MSNQNLCLRVRVKSFVKVKIIPRVMKHVNVFFCKNPFWMRVGTEFFNKIDVIVAYFISVFLVGDSDMTELIKDSEMNGSWSDVDKGYFKTSGENSIKQARDVDGFDGYIHGSN